MKSIGTLFRTTSHQVNGYFQGHAFEDAVTEILKAWHPGASLAQMIARVEKEHSNFFAHEIRVLTAKCEQKRRQSSEDRQHAEKIRGKLHNGEIPEHASDEEDFALPHAFWLRIIFFVLFIFAVLLVVAEVLNLAWFLRFKTQSFPFGILYSAPFFVVLAAEAVALHNDLIGERRRNILMLVQAVAAVLALAAYTYFSLTFADTSLIAAFTETSPRPGPSTEQLRMASQIASSLLISGLCLLGAASLGVRKKPKNPEYEKQELKIRRKNREADAHDNAAADYEGLLAKIQARKDSQILRCYQKDAELKAVEAARATSINQILSE